jgi:hypothetical protein
MRIGKLHLFAMVVLAAAVTTAPIALASGTPGSDGDFGSRNQDVSSQQNAERQARDAAAAARSREERDLYARGRTLYNRRLTCDACPVPDGPEDQAAALALVGRIEGGEFAFEASERTALTAFLTRRFRLDAAPE